MADVASNMSANISETFRERFKVKSNSGFLSALSRLFRKPRSKQEQVGGVLRHWSGDQLWFHSSDEGEEWLCLRLGQNPRIQSTQIPQLGKLPRLLAAASFSVTIEAPPNDKVSKPYTNSDHRG